MCTEIPICCIQTCMQSHTNTCGHCHKHTVRFRDTHSYISITTVPSRSPCAELLIASLTLICWILLGSYHWRVSLRVKNTMLSSLVPSLAFPTPWFKNNSVSNRPPCLGKDSAMLTRSQSETPCHSEQWSTDPNVSVSLISPCQRLGLIAEPRNTQGWSTSTSWCQWCDVNQMVEEIHYSCGSRLFCDNSATSQHQITARKME